MQQGLVLYLELLVPLGVLVGGTLSLWQFALLHDIKHGSAALPKGWRRDDIIFAGAMPTLFGYYLYLRYGHLSHHRDFGKQPLRTLFDSSQPTFEDGDALFVAHRQYLSGDARGEPHRADERAGRDGAGRAEQEVPGLLLHGLLHVDRLDRRLLVPHGPA